MLTQEKFLEKCRAIWGDAYDFSKTHYTKATDKVLVTCKKHGDFEIEARQLYRGHGCWRCGKEQAASKRFDNKQIFIDKAKKIHGDKYDYTHVIYERSNKKVEIICPTHGPFSQKPNVHLSGCGCPGCKAEKVGQIKALTKEQFLTRSKKQHGDRYDYSLVDFINASTPVKILCPVHGVFEQYPSFHMDGHGCPICGKESSIAKRKMTKEEFVRKAKLVHGDKYDYTYTDVSGGVFSQIEICCKKHGIFKQKMSYHLSGNGCQKCALESNHSQSELEVLSFIKNTLCENFEVKTSVRNILENANELDVFIPDKKIAFEFDGIYWHSEAAGKDIKYHLSKTNQCENKGIHLIHIFEDEWENKKEICKSRIRNILSLSENRCYARDCEVKTVESSEAMSFLHENHIQGGLGSTYRYGLYYNGELISLMTFGNLRKNLGSETKDGTYELLRFCNKLNWSVPGAASRLFTHFIHEHQPKEIISYADRRWSNGNLYEKLGFVLSHMSKPNYFYVINGKRCNRFEFRKDILVKKYGCPEDMTEHDFCLSKGWYRIYDCGCRVYKWEK